MTVQQFLEVVKRYFNIMPDMEDRTQVIEQISQGVSFRGANLWVLIFAIFIASLGLNVNSTAVIIGAMLISPLMGPIIGMGLAIGINDIELFKKAWRNFAVATLISVLTAMVYFLVTPIDEAQSELLARTAPTIYDVLTATFGGAAGITALCTAGYGLATGNLLYFLGAFYLFFINTVFITISTFLGVRLMQFPRRTFLATEQQKRAQQIIGAIVVLTMIPAAIMTFGIVRKGISDSHVRSFVKKELAQTGTQIISHEIDRDSMVLNIVAVGKEIDTAKLNEATKRLAFYDLEDYRLNLIQGAKSDSLLQLTHQLQQAHTSKALDQQRTAELMNRNSALQQQLEAYTRYAALSKQVRREAVNVFPQIKRVALSRVDEWPTDSTKVHYVAAYIQLQKGKRIAPDERQRLRSWLQTRIQADSLVLLVEGAQ